MNPFTKLGAVLFALIALAHLYRIVRPFEIVVAGSAVPQWASIVGLIIAGILAFMLWRESRA
jgi:hypothetical protein